MSYLTPPKFVSIIGENRAKSNDADLVYSIGRGLCERRFAVR